jgi:5'-3' exonuclease
MFGAGVRRDAVSRDASRAFVTGLAWVYSYYTNRCLSWTWRYGLPAAPLLADLATHVASVVTTGAPTFASSRPVTPTSQLMYVLPRSAHHLLPPTARTLLSDPKYAYLFPDNAPMHWAFCRWLWEAHVELPTFPVDLLEPAEMSPASLENPKISPEPPKPPKRVRVQRTRVSAP